MSKYGMNSYIHIGVTGHRLSSINYGTTPNNRDRLPIIALSILTAFIDDVSIGDEFPDFTDRIPPAIQPARNEQFMIHTGMADGWDCAIATACIALDIPFVAHLPYENYGDNFALIDKSILDSVLNSAYIINWCNYGTRETWKLMKRNKDVVFDTDFVLALSNGNEFGGTANAIKYAQSLGIPVWNIWDEYLELYTFLEGEAEREG